MKYCTKCNIIKSFNYFHKHSSTKDGHRSQCKECRLESLQKYYVKHKERIIKTNITYQLKNKEKCKLYHTKYRESNKDKFKKYSQIAKKKGGVEFKLRKNLRVRLYLAIKNNQKVGSAVLDLGCSIRELKTYLESKFQPGMSWDNWTKKGWHIDHIRPLSKFDLSNPQKLREACHYSNLQPLWWYDNLSKGGVSYGR